jgi:hypothetical protein
METLIRSLRNALGEIVAFLPDLVAGIIILAIGWIVGTIIRSAIRAALPRMGFDRFLAQHRLTRRPPDTRPGSNAIATAAFWAVMLVALMQAANMWRLGMVASGIRQVLAYVPNLIAATIIFGGALVLGNWIYDRLRASTSSERTTVTLLPGAVRAGILTIAAFIALRQLQIAPEILTIGFTLVFGAIAVATALSFGLGGRRAAERMTEDWYDREQARRPTIQGAPSRSAPPDRPH